MKWMKTFLKQLSLATILQVGLASAVLACIAFYPPGPSRSFSLADNTKTLIVYSNGVEHLIIQPEFRGSLEDFALVIPAPSQPTVNEGPGDLFDKLEDLTNPQVRPTYYDDPYYPGLDLAEGINSAYEPGVRVIERSDVGDYTATVLSATNTVELNNWLEANGYESDEEKDEIIDYYVKTNGYFVALKVNMSAVRGSSSSALNPIDISFKTDAPRVPTRMLAAYDEPLDLVIYTLAPEPYIIPGADVQYSDQIGFGTVVFDGNGRAISKYNPWQQWLVRNKVLISPETVDKDLFLSRIASAGSSRVTSGASRENVNPRLHEPGNGVVRYCQVELPEYLSGEALEFYERFKDTNYKNYNYRYTSEFEELSAEEQQLYRRWQSYFVRYGEILQDEIDGRYYYIKYQVNTVEPDQCEDDGYNFDLAIGAPSRGGGLPIYRVMQVLGWLLAAGVLYYFYQRYRKFGWKKVLPNPIHGIGNLIRWIDKKTGHKLLGEKESTPKYKGYRNSVVLIVAASIMMLLGRQMSEIPRFDKVGFSWNMLLFFFWLMLILTLVQFVYTVFIAPTAIHVKHGIKELKNYLGSVLVASLVYILIVYSIVTNMD
ncbi:MAG: DUF2330 domain-containing protein [Candidatus Saccharimonadales bacterium]|nr:DUF2330 domain-containing protein [Candidatus Saccharimonadales bacterium]